MCDPITAWALGEATEAITDTFTDGTVQEADHHRASTVQTLHNTLGLLHLAYCPAVPECPTADELRWDHPSEQLQRQTDLLDKDLRLHRRFLDHLRDGGDNTSFTGLDEDRQWAHMRASLQQAILASMARRRRRSPQLR